MGLLWTVAFSGQPVEVESCQNHTHRILAPIVDARTLEHPNSPQSCKLGPNSGARYPVSTAIKLQVGNLSRVLYALGCRVSGLGFKV